LQEWHFEANDCAVIDRFDREHRDRASVVSAKKALIGEKLEADEEWIPRTGGKALKGGVGIACGVQRENLPEFLPGGVQEVDEAVRRGTEVADPVGSGQRRRMKQNPTGPRKPHDRTINSC
jgi:hypothetical protein